MLDDIYVPICLLAFLSGIMFIVIIQQLATNKAHILNMLSVASRIFLSVATVALAVATIILAINSKAQIEEARSEFETNQRPWVYANVGPPAGPLSFEQNGPRLSLNVEFYNSGNTPAISVFPNGVLIFDEPEESFLPSARANTQRQRCTHISGTSQGTELTLFPKEHLSQRHMGGFMLNVKKSKRKEGKQQATFEKLPYVVFCIDYQFTYAEGHHLTAKLFSLTSEAPITSYTINAGDPPIPVKATLEGTYAD